MQPMLTEAAGTAVPRPAPGGFVALSRFTIANGMEAEVQQAFRDRPHQVDGTPGFVRMEVLVPIDAKWRAQTRRSTPTSGSARKTLGVSMASNRSSRSWPSVPT